MILQGLSYDGRNNAIQERRLKHHKTLQLGETPLADGLGSREGIWGQVPPEMDC